MITKELLIELAKEQAPEARCVAIDKNINIYAYPDQPILDTNEWLDDEKESTQIFLPDDIWQESLFEIPEEEWYDLTWARDQMVDGKKVVFDGQLQNYYAFFDFENLIFKIRQRSGYEITLPNETWMELKWKLYEESKPEFTKGQRVLVSDTPNGYNLRRIFSHMSGGLYYCFTQGRDEWTSEGKTFAWKHCKVWEEDDE